jgi:hypothetical protein
VTARECVTLSRTAGQQFQRVINQFIDDFRRATTVEQRAMVNTPIESAGALEGLIAAVVSALCRESATEPPGWVDHVASPEPFFPFPSASFDMRLRLMIESPPPFRIRRVFVPENYLSRA